MLFTWSESVLPPLTAGDRHFVGEEDLTTVDPYGPAGLVRDIELDYHRVKSWVGEADKCIEVGSIAWISVPHEGREEVAPRRWQELPWDGFEGLTTTRED